MSGGVDTVASSADTIETLTSRLDSLEEALERRPTREEVDELRAELTGLRKENARLRRRLDERRDEQSFVEIRGELTDEGHAKDPKDIYIGGVPIGSAVSTTKSLVREVKEYIETGERTATRKELMRDFLLPLHKLHQDFQDGDAEYLREEKHASTRRAVRLFGDVIERGQRSGDEYQYTSKQAKRCLRNAEDMTRSGQSTTVRRAFHAFEDFTRKGDQESLFEFRGKDNPNKENTLVADVTRLTDYMDGLEETLEEIETANFEVETESVETTVESDAQSSGEEARAEADALFEAMQQATTGSSESLPQGNAVGG
ncbi:hypothetical protein AUR64_14365 [Haloprofundus marisrubri]|uniref:Uncharacterized protein n=1 Tax=Haloprofundus marisrubri TaxID=1514971 RepID=A0A0W1R6G3_9EURY|nr:hypothetical protein [Haloprofundus marisrubri]KTG08986.1 hypothetical protein AUR64_14365 [Haloprofundus marisrubri]